MISFLYTVKKKSKNLFIINMSIHTMIIYFCFVLINDYIFALCAYKYRCLKAKVIRKKLFRKWHATEKYIILTLLAKTICKFILKSVNIKPKNTNTQIHKHWIKIRFRFRVIRFRFRFRVIRFGFRFRFRNLRFSYSVFS